MARPVGSRTGKYRELAVRWAQAFGSREMLAKEIVGPKNPFDDYVTIQEVERRLRVGGYVLNKKPFDNKSKTYAMSPADVEAVLNEVHVYTPPTL